MEREDSYKEKYQKLCNKLRNNKLGYLILDKESPEFKKIDREYERKYKSLVKRLRADGWIVKEVPSKKLEDYAGQNPYAGGVMGYNIDEDEFHIDRDMCYKTKFETLVHEVNETDDMKKGDTYWEAHSKALKDEHHVGGIP